MKNKDADQMCGNRAADQHVFATYIVISLTVQLISALVFAYAKSRFSYDVAYTVQIYDDQNLH